MSQHLTLIKIHPCIQLGHLYEHIFTRQIYHYLTNRHAYLHLDYDVVAKTYYNGVIFIDFTTYNKSAQRLVATIPQHKVTFDEDAINHAATEIITEKQARLYPSSLDQIVNELDKLHLQPWISADDFVQHDSKNYKLTRQPLYANNTEHLPIRELKVSLSIDPSFIQKNRPLLPLFRQIAWLFMAQLQHALPASSPYFTHKDTFSATSTKVALENTFHITKAYASYVKISDDLAVCQNTIQELLEHKAIERLIQLVQGTSYVSGQDEAPSFEASCEDTLIFTGGAGWRQIATKDNYDAILRHMQCSIKFGNKRVSSAIYSHRS